MDFTDKKRDKEWEQHMLICSYLNEFTLLSLIHLHLSIIDQHLWQRLNHIKGTKWCGVSIPGILNSLTLEQFNIFLR